MASLSFTYSSGCTSTGGTIALESVSLPPGAEPDAIFSWAVVDGMGTDFGGPVDATLLPTLTGLANDTYTVRVFAADSQATYTSVPKQVALSCGTNPGGLQLDQLQLTQPTGTTPTGSVAITVSGGLDPVTVAGIPGATTAVLAGGATQATATGLAPGDYTAVFTDADSPAKTLEAPFTIDPAPVVVAGCQDEYATDYAPDATTAGACAYVVNWRSAWGPTGMAVRVPALAGQTAAYTRARLRIGFRPGHALAADRPFGPALELTATVGPDGFATFRLGPYLRSALGVDDGEDGRRLDLNSPTANTSDLFVGYELRRLTGELLEHGYALNAAVPDGALATGLLLSPFASRLPVWPGFDEYLLPQLNDAMVGKFGEMTTDNAYQYDNVRLPCPANPLPVAWLAPGGGFGYWVFQGRPQLGDEVGEGSSSYQEPESGERRYSDPGAARRTITASSGVFKGADLMEGLRTLWRSTQVWYKPMPGGPWVAVTREPGSFPAGRLGVARQQVLVSFTHAAPEWAQGQ